MTHTRPGLTGPVTFHPSVFLGYCSRSSMNNLLDISKSLHIVPGGFCHLNKNSDMSEDS